MESYDLWKLTPPEPESHPCKICQFDVYNPYEELCEDCQNEEEKEMKSPVEMIKEEFCSRYGLDPKQLKISLTIWDVESVKLANQIKNEYDVPGESRDFLKSYEGYNLTDHEENPEKYITGLDFRGHTYMNVLIYTKNGVIKDE